MKDSVQLLQDYAQHGDEAAFRELVARYIDLVHSVALRRVGGDAELAREVAQSVFADLARKAWRLRGDVMLGGWLHRHTGFVASTVVRGERRRQAREQQAADMNTLQPTPDPVWAQLAPVLDETIDVLDATDRQAIVLRFFEQRDFRAIGATLGVSDDAAQKRVSRALEKLRGLLARRGVTLSLAVLGSLLVGNAVSAAPAGLVLSISNAALVGAASGGIFLTCAKLVSSTAFKLGIGALAAVTAASVLLLNHAPHAGQNAENGPVAKGRQISNVKAPMAVMASSAATNNGRVLKSASDADKLLLEIVAADTGKPVPDVQVDCRIWEGSAAAKTTIQTTRAGIAEVSLPQGMTRLELITRQDGFADTRLHWQMSLGEEVPGQYTVRLTRPVHLGGQVLDPSGQPVLQAKVSFSSQTDPTTATAPEDHEFGNIEAFTDVEGRWSINRVAPDMLHRLFVGASHPSYLPSQTIATVRNREAEKQFTEGSHVFKLGQAVKISGVVVDAAGQPVTNAVVLVGGLGVSTARQTNTGRDGTFYFPACAPGKSVLTASAPGFAPNTIDVELAENSQPFRLVLQPGNLLRFRVVDPQGSAISDARLWLDPVPHGPVRKDSNTPPVLQVRFETKTDAAGRAEWREAPNQEVNFTSVAKGFMRQGDIKARPDGSEHIITLSPALTVSGTVVDAATGQPIPRFRVICGWPTTNYFDKSVNPTWSTLDRYWLDFVAGEFRHTFEEALLSGTPNPGYMFKFEAAGHAPFVTRVIRPDEGDVKLEVKLKPATVINVAVFLPDGRPAVNADVGLVTPNSRLRLMPGAFIRGDALNAGSLFLTDDQGRFSLPPDDAIKRVIVACAAGYADVTVPALEKDPQIRLQPWGTLAGTYLANGQGVSGRQLRLKDDQQAFESFSLDFHAFATTSDADGRFTFAQVPPGQHQLVRVIPQPASGSFTAYLDSPLADVEILPGTTNTITVGATNHNVTVHLVWPAGFDPKASGTVQAYLFKPVPQPTAGQKFSGNILDLLDHTFKETANGTWLTEEVPPGNYLLRVALRDQTSTNRLPVLRVQTEVPANIAADSPIGTLDLGDVVIKTIK